MAKIPSSDTIPAIADSVSKNHGLPDPLKRRIEGLSGIDCSDIRVNMNSHRPAMFGAAAFTQGREIHLGPGQEEFLAHEAWHTIQQKQGRVKPGLTDTSLINNDPYLEREADLMGARAELGAISNNLRIERSTASIPVAIQLAKPEEEGWKNLENIGWSDHYRLGGHDDGKTCLEKSDANETISQKIYAKCRGKKHEGKCVTYIPAGDKGTLVIVTYARDRGLVYDTAYFSKNPNPPGEKNAIAFRPDFKDGFTLTY